LHKHMHECTHTMKVIMELVFGVKWGKSDKKKCYEWIIVIDFNAYSARDYKCFAEVSKD